MNEPYENYLQLHITHRAYNAYVNNLLRYTNILVHYSKNNHMNDYQWLMINLKNKRGVWNTIQTETKVKKVDHALIEQLVMLENVSKDAQVALLLDPV
ncbi:hypothetical protein nACB1_072 [Acinetobacter phage nACB1]|nr:hypothetical protein nACB1_072 [Acinetobacter phage nACB1]